MNLAAIFLDNHIGLTNVKPTGVTEIFNMPSQEWPCPPPTCLNYFLHVTSHETSHDTSHDMSHDTSYETSCDMPRDMSCDT